MSRLGSSLIFLLTLAAGLTAFSQNVSAQSLRLRTNPPDVAAPDDTPTWEGSLSYAVVTDYADTNQPRGYGNGLTGGVTYHLDSNWSFSTALGLSGDLYDGQIDKATEQTYTEAVNFVSVFAIDYDAKIYRNVDVNLELHGEPLWDQPSQIEGYKGIFGGSAGLAVHFFHGVYTLSNSIDVSDLVNSYENALDGTPNPDYSVTYGFKNTFRLPADFKFSYSFGLKAQHYLDDFWGYSYNNWFTLSRSFGKLTAGLAYVDGGFTEYGEVDLWYIDQYRRIARAFLSYSF